MGLAETLLGGSLVLVGGVAGTYLAHHWQLKRERESRDEERQKQREDRRMEELLSIQDDVTDVQEIYSTWAAKKVGGSEIDMDLVYKGNRARQQVWKRAARIDSEELWDLAAKLIAATGNVVRGSTVQEIESAIDEIGKVGAEIQRKVGKLLGGTAKQLEEGIQLPD